MARQKRLHGDPDHYLKPKRKPKGGAGQVVAMLRRMQQAGANVQVRKISSPKTAKENG